MLDEQAVHQLVDHARVAGQDARQIRAGGAERHVQIERRPIAAEELPERRLAAERIAHAAEIHERRIGLGRGGDGRQQPRGDRGQKMPAAARREKANLLGRQGHQVLVGRVDVFERIAAEHLLDSLRRRIGIVHQVDFRLDRAVAGKRVVQQVVENLAVDRRAVRVVGRERHQGRAVRRAGIAHPHGELRQLVAVRRQQVRLQVEHDLQPVLELPQKAVVVFENRALLVREAARLLEPGDGVERVAGADFRQVRRH